MCDSCIRLGNIQSRHWAVEDEEFIAKTKSQLNSICAGAEHDHDLYSLTSQFKNTTLVKPLLVDNAILFNYSQNIEHLFYDYTIVDSRRRRLYYHRIKHHVAVRFNSGCLKNSPINLNATRN